MVKQGRHRKSARNQSLFNLLVFSIILLFINIISDNFYKRFDLTKEKRYSISDASKDLMHDLEDRVYIKVFLEGNFPSGFVRLQGATKDLLNELRAYAGSNLEYEFINPMESSDAEERKEMYNELASKGLQPTNLRVKGSDAYEEKIIFPGAVINYRGRDMPIQLLENQMGFSQEEVLNNSIIQLEYKMVNAIKKLIQYRQPKVGFTSGHGELNGLQIADLATNLDNLLYEIESVDLSRQLKIDQDIEVLVIAKPTLPFEEKDKFKIDQYIMHGGKVLWLLESVVADMDSLSSKQMFMAVNLENNLDDLLFKYGVRINYDLIQDMQMNNPIPLVVGESGGAPQTQFFPWFYYPLLTAANEHAIVRNMDPVAGRFVSSIDTIRSAGIKKTVLLQTSQYSKALLTPARVHLGILREEPNPDLFKQPHLPAAVLLEGEFESVFKNRLAASFLEAIDTSSDLTFKEKSGENRMIVISDGDIIRNDVMSNGGIYPLGFYKYTNQTFANRDFLLNAIEYLMDDSGLIETRTKEIKLRMLDRVRIEEEKIMWQIINVALPILLVLIFGLIYTFGRRKKYAT